MPFPPPFSDTPTIPAKTHDLGDLVTVEATFTDPETELPLDPDVVKLSVTPPGMAEVTYTYLTDAEIVRDSEGNFHADINASLLGEWTYRWFSTGTGQAAAKKTFNVV